MIFNSIGGIAVPFGIVILSSLLAAGQADETPKSGPQLPARALVASHDFVVVPGPTNAVQFRLYTNASPNAPQLFNTFEIEGYGEVLLQSVGGDHMKHGLATSPSNVWLHNILVDDEGPKLTSANSMTVIEQASGREWSYIALDASAAYQKRLEQYRRGILFVEPDLFVLYDHLVAKKPASFRLVLHPPAATRLDAIWHDLRLDLPTGGLRIHAPGRRRDLRSWERIESAADSILPGTVTMQLGPTNKLAALDLLTVFAVCRGKEEKDYAFKLLESNSAIGARIHREGLPTLVGFKLDPTAARASLTGFGFSGPVGVDVFEPKQRRSQ
jgi:hypothetical protein